MSRKASIDELFSEAAQITDHLKRSEFLQHACVDEPDLRQQVEALLATHEDSRGVTALFERHRAAARAEAGEQSGDWIGAYKLDRRLGEGGFGVVFKAEQRTPLRRTVALKILKPGMDARQVILRFEQERQALALMDHPHIARVLDAGAIPTGRPYFVMELADGEAITSFCDRHRLKIRNRLDLFVKVCRAVHHAHQKGIIHRDLKPSNILVNFTDGEPQPKVIDFGIAKALHGKLTDETIQTVEQQFLGTPAYMSPEQALSGGQDVDTRSDIYSLGILLFELLTGTTPIDLSPAESPRGWRELIRDLTIVRPSTRLRRLPPDTAARVGEARGVNTSALPRLIAADLDWIVLKSSAKERDQRYHSAEGLARDVERFLKDRPIEARAPSIIHLTTLFFRRHWLLAGSAAAIALALIVGAVAAGWGWRVAQRTSSIARAESQKAQQLNDILFLGLLRADPGQGEGRDYTVREFLDQLGEDVDGRMPMTPDVECALRDMLAFIYRQTGSYQKALHHGERGLALARSKPDEPRRLASFLITLGEVSKELDQYEDAARYLDECLALRRRIHGAEHPQVIRTVLTAARVRYKLGDRAGGLALANQALETARSQRGEAWGSGQLIRCLNMMEMMLRDEHRLEEAAALNRERLELSRAHQGENHPETLMAQTHLGTVLAKLNRLNEARALLAETLAQQRTQLGDDYPRTLETRMALADCLSKLGEVNEAAALYDESVALSSAHFPEDYPDRSEWIQRAIRFHLEHGHADRAAELRASLRAPEDGGN